MQYAAKIRTVTAMGKQFFRIVVAHYNRARYDIYLEEMVQSFAPCFLIAESGDYVELPSDKEQDNILANLIYLKRIEVDELDWYE